MEFLNSSIDIICLMSSLSEFQSFAASYLMVSSPQVVVLGSGKLGTLFPLKKYIFRAAKREQFLLRYAETSKLLNTTISIL